MADTTTRAEQATAEAQEKARKARQEAEAMAHETKSEAKELTMETKEAAKEALGTAKEQKRPMKSAIEFTERVPSPLYLGLTAGSIILSLILYAFRKKEDAVFVGHWAPTFLALGLFAKLVTRAGEK